MLSTLCAELVGVHSQYCKARVPCGRLSTLAHDTLRMRGYVGVSVLHRMRLVRALSCG